MEIVVWLVSRGFDGNTTKPNENVEAYTRGLNRANTFETECKEGMKDGVVTGYMDDHQF